MQPPWCPVPAPCPLEFWLASASRCKLCPAQNSGEGDRRAGLDHPPECVASAQGKGLCGQTLKILKGQSTYRPTRKPQALSPRLTGAGRLSLIRPALLLGEMAPLVWTGPQRSAHPRQGPSPSAQDWWWGEDQHPPTTQDPMSQVEPPQTWCSSRRARPKHRSTAPGRMASLLWAQLEWSLTPRRRRPTAAPRGERSTASSQTCL